MFKHEGKLPLSDQFLQIKCNINSQDSPIAAQQLKKKMFFMIACESAKSAPVKNDNLCHVHRPVTR